MTAVGRILEELFVDHPGGCAMELRPHEHVIRPISRIRPAGETTTSPPFQPRRSLAVDRVDDAPAGAGHDVEADRG